MDQVTLARIDARIAEIDDYLSKNPFEQIDYVALVRHLATLPFNEECGLIWSTEVLHYYGISDFLNWPECDYVNAIITMFLELGLLVPEHSPAIRRAMRKRYGDYEKRLPGQPYADLAWYRADFAAVLALPVVA